MKNILILIGLFIGAFAFAQEPVKTVFINPGEDIQNIINANPENTLYILKEGTHRLQRINPKPNDMIIGEPGAILNGSKILEDWQYEAPYWTHVLTDGYISGLNNADYCCKCEQEAPGREPNKSCMYWHSLFRDDKPLWRENRLAGVNNLPDTLGRKIVGTDTTYGMIVKPFYGDWYYDLDKKKIYVLEDPRGHRLEITYNWQGADFAIRGSNVNDVVVKGLIIEKYTPTWGAVTYSNASDSTSFWKIENNDIRLNHSIAIVGVGNSIVRSNKLNHNGQKAISIVKTKSLPSGKMTIVDNNEMAYNNFARFNPNWDAGTKFIRNNGIILRNNEVHHNWSHGLWSDIYNFNTVYEGNYIHDNWGSGIFHEISYDATIRCNRLENNRHRLMIPSPGPDYIQSLYISTSSNVEIMHNYIREDSSGRALIVVQSPRGSNEYGLLCTNNINVHDNEIVYSFRPVQHISGLLVSTKTLNTCGYPQNIRFEDNHYHMRNPYPNWKYFAHRDTMPGGQTVHSWDDYRGFGYEQNGTFDTIINDYVQPEACKDIPQQMLVKAKVFLDCITDDDGSKMTPISTETMTNYHPFSGEPWHYSGRDVSPKLPEDFVDWVLLQIRDAADPSTVLQEKAALLLQDGRIVDAYPSLRGVAAPGDTLDGVVFYDLIPDYPYVLSVKTRYKTVTQANHSVILPNDIHYDFTNTDNVTNPEDYRLKPSGIYALRGLYPVFATQDTICMGDTITIHVSNQEGVPSLGGGNWHLEWLDGYGNDTSIQVAPSHTTTYRAFITNTLGCNEEGAVTITVNQKPDVLIDGDSMIRQGDDYTYQADTIVDSHIYQWRVAGGNYTELSNGKISINWTADLPYQVCLQEISSNGCTSDEICMQVYVDNDQDGYNSTDDCDETNPDIHPGATEIPDNGIDEDCDGEDLVTRVYELDGQFIRIYPNPAGHFINVISGDNRLYHLSLYTIEGKLILQEKNSNRIDVSAIIDGSYLLEVKDIKTREKIIEKVVIHK